VWSVESVTKEKERDRILSLSAKFKTQGSKWLDICNT
jgi:hypothetical protein